MPERAGRPFLILAVAFFVLLLGSNLPTPLYAVYRERFGFSSAVLTLVFATYMVVLVPTLLLCGQLSDRLGRKRVIATGLGAAAVGLALFAAAKDTAWLFAARAVQGLSVGMVTGAATAGLVELEPHGDRGRAALYAVLVQAAAVLTIPEPAPAGGRWRVQRPSVPHEIRAGFWRASLTATTVWMVAALYLSVVPSYASKLLDTSNLALLGAIAGSLLAASCIAQLLAARRDGAAGAQPLGLALVVAGLAALVLAFPLHSLAAVFASALLGGAGHGLAFLGAQADLNELAPVERRGEVTAAFISCIYFGVAISAIGVGLLSTTLSLRAAVTIFALVVGATAIAAMAWQLSARRSPSLTRAR